MTLINEPFILSPAYKDYLWGGDRLKNEYNKKTNISPLAETWECSVHPDGLSKIDSGPFKGEILKDILNKYPKMMGKHYQSVDDFPILVKLIDAKEKLSIQVHPDDEYANDKENGQLGKTETWYVLDATDDSYIYYGLYSDVDREKFRNSVLNGEIEKYLSKIYIKKDDIYFIKPGTIHALCENSLVLEVQENSNITYRIYDYNRNNREINLDKALEIANLKADQSNINRLRIFEFHKGYASQFLCRCRYYQMERILLNGEIEYKTDDLSFNILVCINGSGFIEYENIKLNINKGQTLFVPANSKDLKIKGKIEFIKIIC